MKERLKEIRGKIRVSDFASSINVSESAVKSWESGRRRPSDSMIERISYKFGYNIEWIKNGIEPKKTLPLDSGQAIVEILQKDRGKPYPEMIFKLGEIYAESDEVDRIVLNKIVNGLLEKMKKNE